MLIHWFDNRESFAEAAEYLRPIAALIEARLAAKDGRLDGYCCICHDVVQFDIQRPDPWVNLRESIVCPQCNMSGRMRLIVAAIRGAGALAEQRFQILERVTPLYTFLKARYPGLQGCEFIDAALASGSVREFYGMQVEHQDFLQLSYPDASIDLLVHGDVLEHVPDHERALAEAARVVKPGGQMIFTCPFFDNRDEHFIRCRIVDGALKHFHPPAYHGNPLSEKGSLVFMDPGWPLLDDILKAGFSSAEIGLCYDPSQGIVSNNNPYPSGFMWPVIFRAVR